MNWELPSPQERREYYMLAKEAIREWESLDQSQQAIAILSDYELKTFIDWCIELVTEVDQEEEERIYYHEINMKAFRRK